MNTPDPRALRGWIALSSVIVIAACLILAALGIMGEWAFMGIVGTAVIAIVICALPEALEGDL